MQLFTPTALTPAQEALVTMQQLDAEGLDMLADKTKRAFDLMWHNDRATPAEMAEALGVNAAAAFARHAATVQFLLSQKPGILDAEDYTPPVPYQIENDGSLTLL